MCGIAGLIDWTGGPPRAGEVQAMLDALAHRGPDGEGLEAFDGCVLGHRRLSIIDIEGGRQPLSNEDGTVWVTLNGEIYNYRSLREELEADGHRFRTRSDTEVIVHAWESWGSRCVERLRGMFAFAVWDSRKRMALLARDRLGIKPLGYWQRGGRLYFASELQAFHALAEPPTEMSAEALDEYLELGYIPAPATIFRGVRKLPPGHILTVGANGSVTQHRYWKLEMRPEPNVPAEEWVERLDVVLREAVRLHLIADVPLGSFLSGGVDSSIVTAMMARFTPAPVRTFSISIPDPEYDEVERARVTARRLGTIHEERILDIDEEQLLPRLVRHFGEPFADSSMLPTYAVSALAAKSVKVVLAGDGGDEAAVGYPWVMGMLSEFVLPGAGLRRWARGLFRPWSRRLRGDPVGMDSVETQAGSRASFGRADRSRLWNGPWRRALAGRPSLADRSREDLAGLDACERALWLDYAWYLPGDILRKVDVTSMCHGLEVRVPLLDHEFVEMAARIPWNLKVRRSPKGKVESKVLLRWLGRRYLEPDRLTGPKRGFALPLQGLVSLSKRRAMTERLAGADSRILELFERKEIDRLRTTNERYGRFGDKLWLLGVLDAWLREHPRATMPRSS